MKKTNLHQVVTKAQIKPSSTFSSIKKLLLKISIINASLIILFTSTSYMGKEKAFEFLNREFYKKQLSKQLHTFYRNSRVNSTQPQVLKVTPLVRSFYRSSGFMPVWTKNNSVTPNASILIGLLNSAGYYGLESESYSVDKLVLLKNQIETCENEEKMIRSRTRFELLLTDAGLAFMINLNTGIVSFDTIVSKSDFKSLPDLLLNSAHEKNLPELILSIQPINKQYSNLQKGLEKFMNTVVLSDEVIDIPDYNKDALACLEKTKQVLMNLGYLNSETQKDDSTIIVALKSFQLNHGLTPDGTITKNTREMLSMSTMERYRKIAINLDRIRKDTRDITDYVFVNIPSYHLKIIRNSSVSDVFDIVVGNPQTPTPELSSRIDKIISNPRWSVPQSISLNEILPKVKKDSTYLLQHNFQVVDKDLNTIEIDKIDWQNINNENFDYYFVQNSGEANALGLLKFTFKNPYSVYIHDTPSKRYFNNEIRAFSHGCIRVKNPELLAQNLISKNSTALENTDILKLVEKRINRVIELSQPIDIFIRYQTCEADDNYQVYFYKDIYNKDHELIQSLFN